MIVDLGNARNVGTAALSCPLMVEERRFSAASRAKRLRALLLQSVTKPPHRLFIDFEALSKQHSTLQQAAK